MNSTGLLTTPLLCLLGVGLTTACVTDKELGDIDEDTETSTTEGVNPSGGSSGTDSASTSGTSVDPSGTTADPTASTVTTADPTLPTATVTTANPTAGPDDPIDTDTEGDTESDTDGGSVCAEWAPPPGDCEGPGNTILSVQWDFGGGAVEDEMCTVQSLASLGGGAEALVLECGAATYGFEVRSDSPHVPLPLSNGMDVRFSMSEDDQDGMLAAPSFVIRNVVGDLIVAYVNQTDLEIPSNIGPVAAVAVVSGSGCPGSSVAEKCEGDGSILSQRVPVQFGTDADIPLQLFDSSFGTLQTATASFSVFVGEASHLPCWDDDCIGDDSGPFERLEFLVIST